MVLSLANDLRSAVSNTRRSWG